MQIGFLISKPQNFDPQWYFVLLEILPEVDLLPNWLPIPTKKLLILPSRLFKRLGNANFGVGPAIRTFIYFLLIYSLFRLCGMIANAQFVKQQETSTSHKNCEAN